MPVLRLFGGAGAATGEEILQQRDGLLGADTSDDIIAVVSAVMAEDFETGMDCPALGLVRSVDQTRYAGLKHCPGAHGAWFDGHVKSGAEKAVIADAPGRVTEHENFGVRGGIIMSDGAISGSRDDFFVEDQNRADGNFAAFCGFARFGERFGHKGEIGV